ncbi:MAG: DNA polymerase [Candidatus Paceibacteria bacterium]
MNKIFIADIEANGLLDDKKGKKATKIHCLSIGWYNENNEFKVWSTTSYSSMRKFFLNPEHTVVGHNFNLYDIILIERLLNIESKCKIIDTLGLSWYLEPKRKEHSLESYAVDYGKNKVEIENWDNLDISEYIKRCEEDVRLQNQLWENQKKHLSEIYDNNQVMINNLINYISFKLDSYKEQQSLGIKFDEKLAKDTLNQLLIDREKKIVILTQAMPKQPIMGKKSMPKKMYNSKSELSAIGLKWNEFLKEQGLPISHMDEVKYVIGYEEPNPNSHVQIKNWLFQLGWKPENIKHNRNKKTGAINKVPQIKSKDDDGNLCPSIIRLLPQEPALEHLNGLSIINHRISVFEGFIRDQDNGRLYQNIGGLTNTLRVQHRILVNLVKPSEPYGKEIRGCLITDNKDTLLCNADLSGLEDATKQHYIYNYDPQYVIEMRTPGFDPHLDIGVRANLITSEESEFYKSTGKRKDLSPEEILKLTEIKDKRYKAKTTNFCATYGGFPKRIAITAGIPLRQAEIFFNTYWERNKAVNQTAQDCIVKTVRDQMWLFNPVSKLWYSLRYEKDKFSTLNQGTAVWVFDTWLGFVRQKTKIPFQYHDELMLNIKNSPESIQEISEILKIAMKQTNNKLKLNIEIDCSIEFGETYSTCH